MTQSTTPPLTDFPIQRIDAAHRQALVLTGLIGFGLIITAVLVEVLKRSLPAPQTPPANLDAVRIAVFAVAGVVIFTATVLKSVSLRKVAPTGEERLAKLRAASTLTAAFAEIPAVLGLVLFVLGRRSSDFYLLLAVAVYMLARHFPRREAWENYVRRGNAVR
jgi:hypothetical protein